MINKEKSKCCMVCVARQGTLAGGGVYCFFDGNCVCHSPAPDIQSKDMQKNVFDVVDKVKGFSPAPKSEEELSKSFYSKSPVSTREEESKEKEVVGDVGVFNGTEWVKVKPEDVFPMVEKGRQDLKDELVRAGESLKEKNKDYLFFIREHKDESIQDYQSIIQQMK